MRHDGLAWLGGALALRSGMLPLADGAVYVVSRSAAGLLAQPLNPAAQRAMRLWTVSSDAPQTR